MDIELTLGKAGPLEPSDEQTHAPSRAADAGSGQVSFSLERLDSALLEAMWRDLEPRADITFYLSWHWIGTWLELGGPPELVLIGRADGQVVCLGLLRKSVQRRSLIVRSRMLHLHQSGIPAEDVICIEYNGFLCDRRFPRLGAEAIAYLRRSPAIGRFDELQIGGATEEFFEEVRSLGCKVHVFSRKSTAFVDLRSIRESGNDYLASLSANTRYQIKRAVKIYESRGALSLQPARTASEALQFLDELGVLHEETWRRRGGGGGAWRFPFLVAFHRRLIEKAFASGGIDIVKISCGDRPIGYIHCLVQKGWIGSYLSGFAYEDDNKVKPGLVSFYLYAQHRLNVGGDIFDFLAGDHRYKTSLGQAGPLIYTFRVQERRVQLMIEQGLRYAKHRIEALRKP